MAPPAPDLADSLTLFELAEDPDRWENAILAEQEQAKTDAAARAVLESIYCEADRAVAFERFLHSYELRETLALLDAFGIDRHASICEIGGGPGYLSWGLSKNGFESVSLLEPNGHHTSGTGYLRSRPDGGRVTVENDLGAWYTDPRRYDVVLTHNCVHHFRGISYVASCIRQKLVPGGRWLMIREPIVDDARELYELLRTHPYCQKYRVFEFAAPARHYVESLEMAGFELVAVVPRGFANGTLSSYVETSGGRRTRVETELVRRLLRALPAATRELYRSESRAGGLLPARFRKYTRPEAMLFRRADFTA